MVGKMHVPCRIALGTHRPRLAGADRRNAVKGRRGEGGVRGGGNVKWGCWTQAEALGHKGARSRAWGVVWEAMRRDIEARGLHLFSEGE